MNTKNINFKDGKIKRKDFLVPLHSIFFVSCGSVEKPVTVNEIYGSPNSDVIRGTADSDRIISYSGNDQLYGMSGNDSLFPGIGSNRVYAGDGDDHVQIETSDIIIDGGNGIDTLKLSGSLQSNKLNIDLINGQLSILDSGQASTKTNLISIENIDALSVRETEIISSPDTNEITSGVGDDTIYSVGLMDRVVTNSGDDTITIISLPTSIDGGDGLDRLVISGDSFADNLIIDLANNTLKDQNTLQSTIYNIETIEILNDKNTEIFGSHEREVFIVGSGNNKLHASNGYDEIVLGAGSDTIQLHENFTEPAKIINFKTGVNGDKIDFSVLSQSPTEDYGIIIVNTKIGGKKLLTSENHIVIFETPGGYSNDIELIAAINSINGISSVKAQSNNSFVGLWFNNSENNFTASFITKTSASLNSFDEVTPLLFLEGFTVNQSGEFTTDNFIMI